MTVGFVAFHYPRPEDFDDFVNRVRNVAAVLRSVPGCLSADCWVSTDGDDAVVSTGQWESDEAFAASFATVAAADVDVTFDERERRPRQIFKLASR
ncbi:antibiotic biosynthesis monooxygenase family protein [Nocardia anaemiae]|uniref:antibiotic biosynthesis monooxygenase family protein n=1 Tax=Nocardia anaemiae TaxID=263910 RepID=UPI0007A3E9F9|nr:antibiotic biosynthesis monooxygenase family protein [Nocardia anaemiae]